MALDPQTQQQIDQLTQQNKLLQAQYENERQIRATRPEQYKYTSQLDEQTGMLKAPYQFDPTKSEAFGKIREQAMGTGPSAWANLMNQQQQQEQMRANDQAAQGQMGAMGTAQSALAMRGGLGGGARTRMAAQGVKDLMMANQANARQGISSRLNIAGQDEQRKQAALGQVADTELQTQKGNIAAALDEQRRVEAAKQQAYSENMQGWASERQAQATEKSKGK